MDQKVLADLQRAPIDNNNNNNNNNNSNSNSNSNNNNNNKKRKKNIRKDDEIRATQMGAEAEVPRVRDFTV